MAVTASPLEKLTPAARRALRITATAVSGVAATLALMLWLAYTQITDYPTYDLAYAGAFMTGIVVSGGIALLCLITAVGTTFARSGRVD